jgi:hypothetical protein
MALGPTQALTEMSIRSHHGVVKGGQPEHKDVDLTVICEPIV